MQNTHTFAPCIKHTTSEEIAPSKPVARPAPTSLSEAPRALHPIPLSECSGQLSEGPERRLRSVHPHPRRQRQRAAPRPPARPATHSTWGSPNPTRSRARPPASASGWPWWRSPQESAALAEAAWCAWARGGVLTPSAERRPKPAVRAPGVRAVACCRAPGESTCDLRAAPLGGLRGDHQVLRRGLR